MSEWLEELKKQIDRKRDYDFTKLLYNEAVHLIEQVERVEELEYRIELELKRSKNLSKQNQVYRQTLKDIRDITTGSAHILAVEALKKNSNDSNHIY